MFQIFWNQYTATILCLVTGMLGVIASVPADFKEYIIRVHRGYSREHSWHVHRRYNDFYALHKELSVACINLPLPPKKMIGNMDREFISQRLDGLQSYLRIVLNNPILSNQKAVKKFLDPHNYCSVKEVGVTQMSMKVRGEIHLKVVKQLPHIGRRLRKEYYHALNDLSKEEFLLTWTPFGPDKYLDQKKISLFMKSLCGMQHANIASPIKAGIYADGAWVLRPIIKGGTLLDTIYGVNGPLNTPAIKKYANYDLRKSVDLNEIVMVASQILEALAFLHLKGIPYGHLHLGNILYDDGVVQLLDTENQVLGLPAYYREKLVRCRRIKSMRDVDIYCLGLILYELVYGKEFDFCDPKEFSCCSPILRPVLEMILNEEGSRSGLPEIAELLTIEIFQYKGPILPPLLKLASSSRQDLALNEKKTIERLKEDHLKFRQYIRSAKLQEMFRDDSGKLLLLYDAQKCSSKASSCDSDQPRSEVSDGGLSTRTPTPSRISDGTTISEDSNVVTSCVDDSRTALLGAISSFNKNNLRKVNNSN